MKALFIAFFLFAFAMQSALACEISFSVDGTQKEKYAAGDEVIIKVKVTFTHRVCNVAIKETKFTQTGLTVSGSTDWKETSPGTWERKVKCKVTGSKDGKLTMTAKRTCDKEGGFKSITLNGPTI